MSRKKMKHTTKAKVKQVAIAKRQIKNNSLILIKNIDQEFKNVPIALVKQYRHQIAALKEQEKKLKSDIQKAQVQRKIAKDKCASFAEKSTSVAKKKLILAKKAFDGTNSIILNLTSEMEQVKKYGKMLMQNQSNFVALSKQLFKLDKQIEAKTIKKPVVLAKAPKKSISRKKIVENTPIETIKHAIEMPVMEVSETAEMNS